MEEKKGPIILYTSRYCGHARSVRRLLEKSDIPVEVIDIDRDPEARARLIEINGGYASVPTVIFPDGSKLTEPPISRLRTELGIERNSLSDRVRRLLTNE